MGVVQRKLSNTFNNFFNSKKSGGIVLIICTVVSLIFANSVLGANYLSLWQMYVGGLSVEHWVNDGLMAVFFLLIGLELERELYNGELSNFKNALLPIFAALGGIAAPALIHFFSQRRNGNASRNRYSDGNRHRFRAGRSGDSRQPRSRFFENIFDRARRDRRFMRDCRDCRFLHGEVFGLVSGRRVIGLGAALLFESFFQCAVARAVFNRRRVDVVFDVKVGRSRDYCRSSAGVYDSILRHRGRRGIAFAPARTRFAQTRRFRHSADFRTVQYGHRRRRGLGAEFNEREQRGHHRRINFGQAFRHHAFEFLCRRRRHLPFAARFKLAARFRRGHLRRHRFYDVNFYHESRFCRQRGNNQRLENGNSAGFLDGGNNRFSVVEAARQTRRIR